METAKRKCSFCHYEKPVYEFYCVNSQYCKTCASFVKQANLYKSKMPPEDYAYWYDEYRPKKFEDENNDLEAMKETYKYKLLKLQPSNCYVKTINDKEIKMLEKLLHKKIIKKETSDNDGFILEAI